MDLQTHPYGCGCKSIFFFLTMGGSSPLLNRIPHPLPKIPDTQSGGFYYWQRMKLDSKGRHQCAHWCNKQSSGLFVSPWENPWTYRRSRMGVDVSPFSLSHHGRFFSFAESNPSSSAKNTRCPFGCPVFLQRYCFYKNR